MSGVRLQGIRKRFGRVETIRGVDLDIADGEFVVIVGPSGCGKSTLLRLIAGLEAIDGGELSIGGQRVNDLRPADRGIAMVFQSYALYPHMTVYENMAFGMKLARADQGEIDRRVREAAETLELTPLLDRLPKALSGGQRQRVAIGRAIVRDPEVFLFDEPLSNLDASLRTQMRAEIARLHDRMGVTTIYVTHDQVEAMTLADRIVVLRDGAIEQVGAPLDLYHRPATRFVAGFIGAPQMNFLDVQVERTSDGVACTLPGGARLALGGVCAAAETATLGVRPEHLAEAADGEGALRGRVDLVENLGEAHHLHVALDGGASLIARLPGSASHRPGDPIALAMPADQCHLFDSESGRTLAEGAEAA
jgi:ABC-type sugar transport system ATPase subunit